MSTHNTYLISICTLLTICTTLSCGTSPTVVPLIQLTPALHTQTQSLSIHALGPVQTDGKLLTCSSLRATNPGPTDALVESLASTNVLLGSSTTIAQFNLSEGEGRIFFVQAVNSDGALIGNGCKEGETIEAGRLNEISIQVFPTF